MPDPQFILCPYCGNAQQAPANRCGACNGHFDPLSRQVTQQHMGPWFIRDTHHPFRPGCAYSVLVNYIAKGLIKPDTIMRGPTTRQYWSIAQNIPGVAHHLGYCYKCQKEIQPAADHCPHCNTTSLQPDDRETLGLAPFNPDLPQTPQSPQTKSQQPPFPQPKSITLKKSTLPSPPPANTPATSMSLAIDLNPIDAAAPHAITTLDHPITTNPTMPLPKQNRLTKLEWTFITLNIILVIIIGALFLPTILGTTPTTQNTTPTQTPTTQSPTKPSAPTSTPTTSTPTTSPTQQTTSTKQAPDPNNKKATLALLKTELQNLPDNTPYTQRQALIQKIADLQKQIELESFFAP